MCMCVCVSACVFVYSTMQASRLQKGADGRHWLAWALDDLALNNIEGEGGLGIGKGFEKNIVTG